MNPIRPLLGATLALLLAACAPTGIQPGVDDQRHPGRVQGPRVAQFRALGAGRRGSAQQRLHRPHLPAARALAGRRAAAQQRVVPAHGHRCPGRQRPRKQRRDAGKPLVHPGTARARLDGQDIHK